MEETVIDVVTELSEEEFNVALNKADSFTEEVTETEIVDETEENDD